MKYFYIDTSSSYLYIAILNGEKLFEVKKKLGSEMSKYTLSEIAELFEKANLEPIDIDKIIVVSGPGSYTGIRIGMTFAKIMAYTLKKEIISITSLEAIAYSFTSKMVVVPVIDARRGFVFAGLYENSLNIMENQYIKLDDLKEYLTNLKKEYIFVGESSKFKDIEVVEYEPDFLKIINIVKDRDSVSPHSIEPEYLKLTEAEENLKGIHYDN